MFALFESMQCPFLDKCIGQRKNSIHDEEGCVMTGHGHCLRPCLVQEWPSVPCDVMSMVDHPFDTVYVYKITNMKLGGLY